MNHAVVDRRTKMYFKKQRFAGYKLTSEKESQTQRNTAIVGHKAISRAYNSHTDLGKQLIPMLYITDVYTLHFMEITLIIWAGLLRLIWFSSWEEI